MRLTLLCLTLAFFMVYASAIQIETYVIGFGIQKGSSDEAALMQFAEERGGTYLPAEDASSPRQLQEAIQQGIRGELTGSFYHTVTNGAVYTWTKDNLQGLFYDMDNDIGNEEITFNIKGSILDEPKGALYSTKAQSKKFKFEKWGTFKTIGFIGKEYFAGYSPESVNGAEPFLYEMSDNSDLLADEQLSEVLIDDDTESTFTNDKPLKLKDGYELAIKSVDINGDKVYLELRKDGQIVDNKAIQPSLTGATMADQTYYYKKDFGDTKNLVSIAVHFRNAFRSGDSSLATADGSFQLSDKSTQIGTGKNYGKMKVASIDATNGTIAMDNKDNAISLNKNKEIELIPNFIIKTSDQDEITARDPLRFYIYKVPENGSYRVRGPVQTVIDGNSYTLSSQNFIGLFYDIDKNIGDEKLQFTIAGEKLDEPDGIIYTSNTQAKKFNFKNWGKFDAIGFLGKEYFAGYSKKLVNGTHPFLYTMSEDSNLLADEFLSDVLIDDDTEKTIASGEPLKLEDGYELAVKSIDIKGDKVYLELSKDEQVVDSKAIQPSLSHATMADKTYYYKKDIGNIKNLVILAVHFKNAFRSADRDLATVDGIFQISDAPTSIKVDTKYGKMSITSVDAVNGAITMNNKDNAITLSKNKDVTLMSDFGIKTADQDDVSAKNPLRFYIYKTISG